MIRDFIILYTSYHMTLIEYDLLTAFSHINRT